MTEAEVSRTLALAWGMAAAPQRGPKRELTLERIVDAAIEIADSEGLGAVTMQRVAKTFGFSTMALYRYVSTKDDLHQLMLDAAMSRCLEPIAATDWRDGVIALTRGLVASYRTHPWTLDIPLSPDIHMMPGQIRVADMGLRAMRELHAPAEAKLGILMLLSAFARGHSEVEREVLAGIEVSAATRVLMREAVTLKDFPDVGLLVQEGSYFGEPDTASPGGADVSGSSGHSRAEDAHGAEADAEEILSFATAVLVSGLEAVIGAYPVQPEHAAPRAELSPQEAYEVAEANLREHKRLRKQAQQQVRHREREVAELQKVRDRAKELAKAHQKLHRD